MANPPLHQSPTSNPLNKRIVLIFLTILLCSFSYILGISIISSNTTTTTATGTTFSSTPLTEDHSHCLPLNLSTHNHNSSSSPPLDFKPHHTLPLPQDTTQNPQLFSFCSRNFTHYCPCHDRSRERQFSIERRFFKERHCPVREEKLRCLVPRPVGYKIPVSWPKSRDYVWFKNVPFPKLTEYKKSQNWVRLEGDRLIFPGGGTSFPKGVKGYVDEMKKIVPLKSGKIRTVLDVGCGVASFGASLMDFDILTMSVAPRDAHEAQVQFALERGLPAMLGVLSTYQLPYPSRAFDMAHCSRCLVPWTDYDGLYLMEIDRILRPGGYWVLSGPPISWRVSYKGWQERAKDLENEQIRLEDVAKRLCWNKIAERGSMAVWRKPTNHIHCIQKLKAYKSPHFCVTPDSDTGWYKKMDPCITPLPNVTNIHDISGGALEKWPKRLNTAPPRIRSEIIQGTTIRTFNEDSKLWIKRVSYYRIILKTLSAGKFRNIMDMNAGLGGFAAALSNYPVWVMNAVPSHAKHDTLGIVYERGLIGTYMNWCEPFSTYPRSYDLIHAHGVFSIYKDKCDILDILFEMFRILRPEGAIIVRDHVDIIVKVKGIMERMRWSGKLLHSERGPFHPEKVLLVGHSE